MRADYAHIVPAMINSEVNVLTLFQRVARGENQHSADGPGRKGFPDECSSAGT